MRWPWSVLRLGKLMPGCLPCDSAFGCSGSGCGAACCCCCGGLLGASCFDSLGLESEPPDSEVLAPVQRRLVSPVTGARLLES